MVRSWHYCPEQCGCPWRCPRAGWMGPWAAWFGVSLAGAAKSLSTQPFHDSFLSKAYSAQSVKIHSASQPKASQIRLTGTAFSRNSASEPTSTSASWRSFQGRCRHRGGSKSTYLRDPGDRQHRPGEKRPPRTVQPTLWEKKQTNKQTKRFSHRAAASQGPTAEKTKTGPAPLIRSLLPCHTSRPFRQGRNRRTKKPILRPVYITWPERHHPIRSFSGACGSLSGHNEAGQKRTCLIGSTRWPRSRKRNGMVGVPEMHAWWHGAHLLTSGLPGCVYCCSSSAPGSARPVQSGRRGGWEAGRGANNIARSTKSLPKPVRHVRAVATSEEGVLVLRWWLLRRELLLEPWRAVSGGPDCLSVRPSPPPFPPEIWVSGWLRAGAAW